jgi:nucleoside-diphosphate-sugar epimerase
MVVPAVKGSETLLTSALKAGPQLTSVVVTSSVAAVINPKEGEYTFTEADFASVSLDRATEELEEGIKTPTWVLYGASKTAAERAVWKFKDEHKVRCFADVFWNLETDKMEAIICNYNHQSGSRDRSSSYRGF